MLRLAVLGGFRPPLGGDVLAARPGGHGIERDAVALLRLLDARPAQDLDHPRDIVLPVAVVDILGDLGDRVRRRAVRIHDQRARRRDRFDRERTGHAHAFLVLIRLVVEIFRLGDARDGVVDLLLPRPLQLHELCVRRLRRVVPAGRGRERDLPLFRRRALVFARMLRQLLPQIERGVLVFLPDDVDLGIVRDRLQCDVRHARVDEALRDLAVRLADDRLAGDFHLLLHARVTIRQQIVRKLRRHEPRPRKRERHPARVDRDPPPPPLLRYIRRRPRSARRVKHQVAGIGRHQHATLDNSCVCLNYVNFLLRISRRGIRPICCVPNQIRIISISFNTNVICTC